MLPGTGLSPGAQVQSALFNRVFEDRIAVQADFGPVLHIEDPDVDVPVVLVLPLGFNFDFEHDLLAARLPRAVPDVREVFGLLVAISGAGRCGVI